MTMQQTVLFIDDDANLLAGIGRTMRREPFRILCVETIELARTTLGAERVDLVVCDEHLPGTSGSEFLAEIRESHPSTLRVMLTGQATLGAVVHAINAGEVFRFLLKPCGHGELVETIRHALAHKMLMDRCRHALRTLKLQNEILQEIERQHPGITARAGDTDPNISDPADSSMSPETLVSEISAEIERSSGVFKSLGTGKPAASP
ncbi:MAG: response regulator [Planctomycetes bacterium]|nr:response regulator [Planctomycetota bacterium]